MSLDPQKLADLLAAMATFNTAIRGRLDLKLDSNATAVNSAQLGGLTLQQVIDQIGGAAAAELQTLSDEFDAFVARRDNPHAVSKTQVGLGDVDNFATATDAEAVAAQAVDKFLTPAGLAAFWADKVGTAPETLDTIQELAAALNNNPDALTALQTIAGDNAVAINDLRGDLADAIAAAALDATTKADAAQAAAIATAALDATAKADAAGVTAAEYTDTRETAIRSDMNSGLDSKLGKLEQAADSAKLEGFTKAQIIAEAQAGVDMSEVVLKDDDFGQYSVGESTLANLVAALQAADIANNASIVDVEDALTAFIASKATAAEVVAGTDDEKYVTALGAKAAIDGAIASLVDGAPEALNTLRELAEAIGENEGGITDLITLVGTKLNQAQVQAEIAGVTDALTTRIADLEDAIGGGSDFMQTGITDLGENPVALQPEDSEPAEEVRTLKQWLISLVNNDQNLRFDVDDHIASINASMQAVQDQAGANAGAISGINTTLGGHGQRLDAAEASLANKLEAGDAIGTNTVDFYDTEENAATAQALNDVLEQLRLSVLAASSGASDDLDALQAAFNAFVASKATGAEVIAGTDDVKYTTSVGVKAAINAAVQELVGTAPEALNTINELAAALNNDPDIINQLMTQIGGKLAADAQAVDSALLEGRSIADMTADNADVATGTATDKFVTPAALKSKTDAQDLAIAANTSGLAELMIQLAAAFDDAAAELDPTPPSEFEPE